MPPQTAHYNSRNSQKPCTLASVYMRPVQFSKQTAIITLYIFNRPL